MESVCYTCWETGQITEAKLDWRAAQFATVKKYDVLYAESLESFRKHPLNVYALPLSGTPRKVYLGTGRMGLLVGRDALRDDLTLEDIELALELDADSCCELLFTDEDAALQYLNLFCDAAKYELIYVRNSGEQFPVPGGYRFIGYDVSYFPSYEGSFSILCDCMFVCRWHGCDSEGTLFAEDFSRLNESGLFDSWQDAHDYMIKYLGADWTERGTYCILEIYQRK